MLLLQAPRKRSNQSYQATNASTNIASETRQALRRSIKGDKKDLAHHHVSITPKSAVAIVPPKKVRLFASSPRVPGFGQIQASLVLGSYPYQSIDISALPRPLFNSYPLELLSSHFLVAIPSLI